MTPIAELLRSTMVAIEGTVERITDEDEFRLADGTGSVRMDVGPDRGPVEVGEVVRVFGYMDDGFRPEIMPARSPGPTAR